MRLSSEEQIDKLMAKAFHGGLDDIDHKKLTRLIEEADAQELLITAARRDKAIFTWRSREFIDQLPAPNKKEVTANE